MTSSKPTRRRRLLAACRWRSKAISLRGHVRSIERLLDRRPS